MAHRLGRTSTPAPHPRLSAAIQAATMAFTRLEPPLLPTNSNRPRRGRRMSMHSGRGNWPLRPRFPSTRPRHRSSPTCPGSKVHGYVAKPARQGRFPAIIQLQYAGIYALDPHWAAQRASDGWLVIDVDAHDKLPSDPSGDIPKAYVAVGNTDREKSYFLNMYLRDSRALDY